MKYVKIFFFAAIAALAFSCTEKIDYPEFEFGPQEDTTGKVEVFFVNTVANEELEPTQDTYEITLGRSETTGALSVALDVYDPANVFGVPKTVDFADGAATATLSVDITKMELETPYELTLTVPSTNFYAYKKNSDSDKIRFHLTALKQKWVDAGTCTFYDDNFYASTASAAGVKIQNHEGTDDYRIIAPYNAIDADDWPEKVNFLFSVVKNKIEIPAGFQDLWAGSGYTFYYDAAGSYKSYCTIDPYEATETGILVGVNHLIGVGKTPTYIGFFSFDWTGGPLKIEAAE